MSDVAVGTLTLHVPAMSREEAHALARDVARALRRWPATPSVGARLSSVTASVEAGDLDTLAERIAEAVYASALRELAR